MSRLTISIIGSASPKQNINHDQLLTPDRWNQMVDKAEHYIMTEISPDWSQINLVSGGSSWSDHIAVYLYNRHPEAYLTLHLPCRWDHLTNQFVDNGASNWSINPGKTLNVFHQRFSQRIDHNSLADIRCLMLDNQSHVNIVSNHKGFHARNLVVGQSQYLLAFSFATGSQPDDGGTLYTWNHAKSLHKQHFSISNLI